MTSPQVKVGGPGDGIGIILFGGLGMLVAGIIGVVVLVIFWSVLVMRREAARETGKAKSYAPKPKEFGRPRRSISRPSRRAVGRLNPRIAGTEMLAVCV